MADKTKTTRNQGKSSKPAKPAATKPVVKEEIKEEVSAPTTGAEDVSTETTGTEEDGSDKGVTIEGVLVNTDIEPGDGVQLGTDGEKIVLSNEEPSAESLDSGTPPVAARGESAHFVAVDELAYIPDTSKAKIVPAEQKPVESVFSQIAANKAAKPNKALILIEESLNRYASVMAPGVQHKVKDGAKAQANFYRTYMRVLAMEGQDFYQGMDLITNFVTKHRRGMFAETRAFRYFDSSDLKLSTAEIKNFERMMHVLITLSNRHIRSAAIKQIDLSAALSGLSDQAMHQRVVEYFTA